MATKKTEMRKEWLGAAMALYDSKDEDERRELFQRTCWTASGKFTAKQLQEATAIILSTLGEED